MKILKWCRQLLQWLRDSWGHNYVALSRGSCFWFVHLWKETLPTLKVTLSRIWWTQDGFLDARTHDSDAYSFFMNLWITAILPGFSSEEKSYLTSIDGWGLLASVIFLRNLLRQQSVEEQVDQPKHDSQCLLEKQCGIKIKSLQKVKEDGWPSLPRDVIGARLLIVPCNRHDIKHSHATCKHSAIAYRKSLKFLCHKTFAVRPEQAFPTTMHEGVDNFSQSMCL